jgi:cyd operon protein YbgT
MWYFTWFLGIAAALSFGIINVMWFEAHDDMQGQSTPTE